MKDGHALNRKIGLTLVVVLLAVLAGFFVLRVHLDNNFVERHAVGLMDTDVLIKAYGRKADRAIQAAFEEMARLDVLLNAHSSNSEVSAINNAAGVGPASVSPDTLLLVKRALHFARRSEGAFDPTILPLMRLWGFGDGEGRVPSQGDIFAVLELVDYGQVYVDETAGQVSLGKRGMGLDLGAIAKGYAVDRMVDILTEFGVKSFLINAGGSVHVGDPKPDGSLWRVAVTDPRDPDRYLGVLSVSNTALVSSGDYQRYFTEDGVKYHHIMDPKTGYPSRGVLGTTVVYPSSTDADGLSTALFVLGPDACLSLMEGFPGASAVFVLETGETVVVGPELDFELEW